MLIKILILFFILLIIFQLYSNIFRNSIMEGFTYQPYSSSATGVVDISQNVNNIEYLYDQQNGIQTEVTDISSNMATLNAQVIQISEQLQNSATQIAGSEPLDISGSTT